MFYFQPKKKKKTQKKFELKYEKKNTYITKPSPSMASQAHGEPITGSSLTASPFSTKKKNTESEIEPNQPIMSLAPGITSRRRWLAERSNPNTKANQTQNSANQTQSTEVFIKKKKKKNPQYTNQNQTQ